MFEKFIGLGDIIESSWKDPKWSTTAIAKSQKS